MSITTQPAQAGPGGAMPFTAQKQADFEKAFKKVRDPANRKNANKADELKQFFVKEFGSDPAVAHITEKKNVSNRFNDQGGRNPSYTLFYVDSAKPAEINSRGLLDYTIERLDYYLGRFTDPSRIKAVLLFLPSKGGVVSMAHVVDYTNGSDPIVLTMRATFPSATYEQRTSGSSVSSGSVGGSAPAAPSGATSTDSWRELSASLGAIDDPCGLVELGTAFVQALAALRAGKHLLFIGPPGTGKTELAECLCGHLNIPHERTVATAEWSTATVTGGYLQVSEGGEQVIDFVPGLATAAMSDGKWLIVDEFNRADMDKAFGELFNVLLGKTVRLPFLKREDGKQLPVYVGNDAPSGSYSIPCPEDWRLIAAMNSFDKFSLSRLSLALMRRFAAIPVELPSAKGYAGVLQEAADDVISESGLKGAADADVREVASLLESIFAADGNGTLRGQGLGVGPSIPIDVLRYAAERICLGATGAASLVAEGCQLFLFPQYEGRDGDHDEVIGLIGAALGFSEGSAQQNALDRALATYTGQVQR